MFSGPAEHVIQGMKGRTGHLDDWVAETPESIAARLESAKSAQGQARRTMGIMSIISMMMLIASYNAYLSYDTTWILDLPQNELAGGTTVAGVLTDQALKDWAASRSVQVPLLGIRTSVDDAPVLGTANVARAGVLAGTADETRESHRRSAPERHGHRAARGRRAQNRQGMVLRTRAVSDG